MTARRVAWWLAGAVVVGCFLLLAFTDVRGSVAVGAAVAALVAARAVSDRGSRRDR